MTRNSIARLATLGLLALAIGTFPGCSRQDQDSAGLVDLVAPADKAGENHAPRLPGVTLYGPAVPVGHGTARTFITRDYDGTPVSAGIDLSAKALTGLPEENTSWVLRFHPRGLLPYTHVYMDWNPNGHEPPGTYDVPHFDCHFYFIPIEDRLAIGPDDDDEFANAPELVYIPEDYMQIPGGVPQMGAHWVDLLAPEFNGQPFTRTFIWGTYDGEVIFFEPMITLDYLESSPNETIPIRQPQSFQKNGYYPMSYSITTQELTESVRISLDGLALHNGE